MAKINGLLVMSPKKAAQLDREIADALVKPDPYRNSKRDVADALAHVLESIVGLDKWPADTCFTEKRTTWPLSKILSYDDYSAWGEWQAGELIGLSREQLFEEFERFRGRAWAETAMSWLNVRRPAASNIPAVVIFDSRRFDRPDLGWSATAIGDGRGRVSLAVGLGLKRLPVTNIVDCNKG